MGELQEDKAKILRVGGTTSCKQLAMSIFASHANEKLPGVIIRGIGAGAISQMTKAYIIAKGHLAQKGVVPTIDMNFKDVDDNITAIEFKITF